MKQLQALSTYTCMVLSESIGRTKTVILVTTVKSPEGQMVPIRGKWSIGEMQIPVRKAMPWLKDMSQKAKGTKPLCQQSCFSHEISIKVNLY